MTELTVSTPSVDRHRIARYLQVYGVYAAVAVLLIFNALFTDNFLAVSNLRTQVVQVSPVVIVALGMALVIGTEGIDLSVGSVMALAAAVLPMYLGYGVVPAILLAPLALFVGGRGLALALAGGQLKQIHNSTLLAIGGDDVLGVPVIVLVAALLAIAVGFVVQRTTFGRQLVAIGGNRAASQLAGLPVRRVLLVTYIACGAFAALAGVLATARLTASDPSAIGNLMELSAITAVVVGGTPLSGGRVRVLGTVAGALLMQLLRATLIKHDLPDSMAQMVQAVIILVAVYVARERRSR